MHQSHNWRYSDSSLYDAVCTQCNCTDNSLEAVFLCGNVPEVSRFVELARAAGLKGQSETALSPNELKFAVALIQECATLCDPEPGIRYSPNCASGRKDCKQNILKHFGMDKE